MRAEALQLSNLRKKRTKSAQTDVRFSHQEAETQVEVVLACQAWNVIVGFFSTSLPLATARLVRLTLPSPCPLLLAMLSISLINIKRKNLGIAENRTWGCWVGSKYVLCSPPPPRILFCLFKWSADFGSQVS